MIQALRLAAQRGDVAEIENLIKFGVDITADENRALRTAAQSGHLDAVNLLYKDGADIHAFDNDALRAAAENGHKNVVARLLELGADIHAEEDDALYSAAGGGHAEMVRFLLDSGANTGTALINSVFNLAVSLTRLEVMDVLLEYGANIQSDANFALRQAATAGSVATVAWLLAKGADIHERDDLALRLAAMCGHTDVIKLLIEAGSPLTAMMDDTGIKRTARIDLLLTYASTARRGYEAVMMLDANDREKVLRSLYPELKPKQIHEEVLMLIALGLDAAQIGGVWQDRHGAATKQQENGVSP